MAGNPFSMCKSPRDLNFALSSSFNLVASSLEGGLELDLDSLAIGITTIGSMTSTTTLSGSRGSGICCSVLCCSAVTSKFSESFKISFSFSASLVVALIVMVFLLLDFFGRIGLDRAERELDRLPREKRPESAPPVTKF